MFLRSGGASAGTRSCCSGRPPRPACRPSTSCRARPLDDDLGVGRSQRPAPDGLQRQRARRVLQPPHVQVSGRAEELWPADGLACAGRRPSDAADDDDEDQCKYPCSRVSRHHLFISSPVLSAALVYSARPATTKASVNNVFTRSNLTKPVNATAIVNDLREYYKV